MAATPDELKNSPTGLGDKINELAEIRDRKAEIARHLKQVNEQFDELQAEIIHDLDAQGTMFAGSGTYRAGITETVVPNITDFDSAWAYARDNDMPYLFERRIASRSWRELVESGETVPGTEPFTKRGLSLTKR